MSGPPAFRLLNMAMTLQLDDEASVALARVAKARGQAMEAVAKEAILDLVAEEQELIELARKGQEDFAAGRWITHEQMVEHLRARRQKLTES
jgi:predicted transcriptional regulator